jgi:hypothetical protein
MKETLAAQLQKEGIKANVEGAAGDVSGHGRW